MNEFIGTVEESYTHYRCPSSVENISSSDFYSKNQDNTSIVDQHSTTDSLHSIVDEPNEHILRSTAV